MFNPAPAGFFILSIHLTYLYFAIICQREKNEHIRLQRRL